MTSVLIVAGENSGEKYGAGLVRAFRRLRPDVRFFGVGGREMAAAGVEILSPLEDLAVVGIFEVISSLPRLRRVFSRLRREAAARRPAAAVLIDSPDFNLRLAAKLKSAGVPVLYYVSPTVWAWRSGRLKTIKKHVSRMLLIFPFEKPLYDREGIPAAYIGHPLLEYLPPRMSPGLFLKKHGLDPKKKTVVILPGSRPGELARHMPVLARALPLLRASRPLNIVFVLAENLERRKLVEHLPPGEGGVLVIEEDRFEAVAAADVVLSACGTANLETAVLGRPLVTFYKISPLTYLLGRKLVKVKRFSMVNILAGRDVVPELIQERFTPERLGGEALRLLGDGSATREMAAEFRRLRKMLGRRRPSLAAARELGRLIGPKSRRKGG